MFFPLDVLIEIRCVDFFSRYSSPELCKLFVLIMFLDANIQVNATITSLKTELCFHVEVNDSDGDFDEEKISILQWILKEPLQINHLARKSVWDSTGTNGNEFIIEIGPRLVHILIIAYFQNNTD